MPDPCMSVGIDNGALWFDHVRVPRDNLLDATSSVSPAGTFDSAVEGTATSTSPFLDQSSISPDSVPPPPPNRAV